MVFGIMKLFSEEWFSFNLIFESFYVVLVFFVFFFFLIVIVLELVRKCDFKFEVFFLLGDKLEEVGRRRVLLVFGSK